MKDALTALLSPKSIVIVGASPDSNKITNARPPHNLMRDGYPGRVYAINEKHSDIFGIPCFPDLDSLPEVPELGVVALAAQHASRVVAELGKRGVKTAIVFGSGFAEAGPEGKRLEQELLATARANNIRICGPNNLGVINAFERMTLSFSQYADQPAVAGPIGFVTQSGAFGTAVATHARALGIGFGYFVSTGNAADISAIEVLDEIVDDARVSVAMAYLEGVSDGAHLIAVADKAITLGKPLILIKVGRYPVGKRAAMSHTGSLAVEDAVFDSIVRQHGVVRAFDEMQALDLARVLATCDVPPVSGLGLMTLSGGAGVMMSDCAEELQLEVPVLSPETQAALKALLPAFAATENPVDVTAGGRLSAFSAMFGATLDLVLGDPRIGLCVVWLQHRHRVADEMADYFIAIRRRVAKPFIVCWLHASDATLTKLREGGVCVMDGTRRSIDAAAALIRYGEARRRRAAEGAPPCVARTRAPATPAGLRAEVVPAMEARELLTAQGVRAVSSRLAADPEQAASCADALGYPVAVKIESPDVPHKTEVGGVRLGLADRQQVIAAASDVLARTRSRLPQAEIAGVLVQPMAAPGVELVLGVRRDPTFGPIVMLGLGGIFVEVLKDVVFASVPVTRADAEFMLRQLKARAVLDGVRGRPGADRASLVDSICALSAFAVEHPEVTELDLNPVFSGPHGTVAVDWLMVRDATGADSAA